jgi:Uma2 family endonuclease
MPVATKLTYEDYAALPDDGKLYELIDGELIVNPSPIPRHQWIALQISTAVHIFVRKHGLGRTYAAPVDVVLSTNDVVVPDIIFISRERLATIGDKNVTAMPDLAVEVMSPWSRKRDEVVKRNLYERSGAREYWIVDPVAETVKIYRRTGEQFERVAELAHKNADTITTPLLPGFELPLAEVFAED